MLLALVSPHYTSAACLPWWLPPFMANHGQNHSVSSGLTVAQGWKVVPSAFGWSVVYPMLEVYRSALALRPSPLTFSFSPMPLSPPPPLAFPSPPRPPPLATPPPHLASSLPSLFRQCRSRLAPSRPSPLAFARLKPYTPLVTNALSPLPSRSHTLAHPRSQAQPTRLARDSALRAPNCTDPKCTGGCLCLPRDSADEAFRGETVVSTSYFTVSSLAGGVHRSKPKWEQQKDYATAIVFADYDGDGDQDVALRVVAGRVSRDGARLQRDRREDLPQPGQRTARGGRGGGLDTAREPCCGTPYGLGD